MASRYGCSYDPKYPWRPMHTWDHCPGCFENFDLSYKCDNCGGGHDDYDSSRAETTVVIKDVTL